ncbi:hypothetical protein [Aliarcobacter butzleri]|uniref:hypothetical protein n=1 Tax=Aliarcobacter butzleri TaxID=28197 RepID=UPI001918A96B|nr:hypothetical protein [Aliarcobacter butzleri]
MPYSINQAEVLIDNLLAYYDVSTYSDLALKIDTTQANISVWKTRNSINAIKKKCKELGIYNEIFGNAEIKYDLELGKRFYSDEEVKKMRALSGDFDFTEIDKIKEECKKWNIRITDINNEKILYYFETLFRDCDMNNRLLELEKDIKDLILKYNPKIDKSTQDLFFEFLEKNRTGVKNGNEN